MKLIKIFISSVQAEFSAERKALHENLMSVPLLSKFFTLFAFKLLPSIDTCYLIENNAKKIGLKENDFIQEDTFKTLLYLVKQ